MIERMKRLDRKLMYQGSILDVYKDTMEFPNGTHEEWDFVSHRMGAAAILPVLPDGSIVTLWSERHWRFQQVAETARQKIPVYVQQERWRKRPDTRVNM